MLINRRFKQRMNNLNESKYNDLINEIQNIKTNKDDISLKKLKNSFGDISRDVNRTFHNNRYHNGDLSGEMTRVLECLSFINPQVGYCQGMNFISGALICMTENEEKAFWIFCKLLEDYEMKETFTKNMPDYAIRVYQLNYYVQKFLPDIYYHFKKNKIPFDIIYSRFLITIFSQYVNFEDLIRIWTLFILVY